MAVYIKRILLLMINDKVILRCENSMHENLTASENIICAPKMQNNYGAIQLSNFLIL